MDITLAHAFFKVLCWGCDIWFRNGRGYFGGFGAGLFADTFVRTLHVNKRSSQLGSLILNCGIILARALVPAPLASSTISSCAPAAETFLSIIIATANLKALPGYN